MIIVADTNTFLAVALDEPERDQIIELTTGHELIAPAVLPFEIGNALTAMMKRGVLERDEITPVWQAVQAIAVDLRRIDIEAALSLAIQFGTYAYDAYFLECALRLGVPLLTLDKGMQHVARQLNMMLLEDLA